MSVQQSRSRLALSKNFMNLQDQYSYIPMEVRRSTNLLVEGKKMEYCRSFSQGHNGRMWRYFTLESLFLLVCLTASLLILPLVLPPLPPPPSLLLLLPICILGLLMVLAFTPSNTRGANYTYA